MDIQIINDFPCEVFQSVYWSIFKYLWNIHCQCQTQRRCKKLIELPHIYFVLVIVQMQHVFTSSLNNLQITFPPSENRWEGFISPKFIPVVEFSVQKCFPFPFENHCELLQRKTKSCRGELRRQKNKVKDFYSLIVRKWTRPELSCSTQ